MKKQLLKTSLFSILTMMMVIFSCKSSVKVTSKDNAEHNPMTALARSNSIKIQYSRGPYQTNGASPWFGKLSMGSNQQVLKFGLDTGNNANWVTSTQCTTPACTQPGRVSFNFDSSSTFTWINKTPEILNFGPWGNMTINVGQDNISNGASFNVPLMTMLSIDYSGTQFAELDWDGGIGFPAQNADPRTTWLLQELVNTGQFSPGFLCVSFYMDPLSRKGVVDIGNFDTSAIDVYSWLAFPLDPYPALNYLWSTPLESWSVAGQDMGTDSVFVFDTGASDFKGDTSATDAAVTAINNYYNQNNSYPPMELVMGMDWDGNPGRLVLTDEQYVQQVQAGPNQGEDVIAIDTLDIPKMLLVGSVILEDLYTVFWYNVIDSSGNYQLSPVEVWLFNKKNGPVIIQNQGSGQ